MKSSLQGKAGCHGMRLRGMHPVQHVSRQPRRTRLNVEAVFEKFTERSIKSVMMGQQEAKNLGSLEVTTEHILLGLVAEAENTQSKSGYLSSGLTFEQARSEVENALGRRRPNISTETIPFSREVKKTFEAATNECKRTGVNFISPEHILLAILLVTECGGRRLLERLNINCEALRQEAHRKLKGDQEATEPRKKQAVASGSASDSKDGPKALDEFCRDLCADVAEGRIDPVIGREAVVSRVIQILARRTKNNPILLGQPGVGKTAVAEGLAAAIVNGRNPDGTPLPEFLRNKRVLQLDVALMIAGAKERGELESRTTRLINEASSDGNVILMIDEVHTLVGAGAVGRGGSAGSGLDISNMLKPALARGVLQVIGATTLDEHRKHIERDPALERRFQPVMVDEPAEDAALAILHGLRERYERHHRCHYTPDALEAAVKLSHRYIADRFLPDKAIDLIDEAGSRVRIRAFKARKDLAIPKTNPKVAEYLQVMEAKEHAIQQQLFEEASILAKRQEDYRWQLGGHSDEGPYLPVVTIHDIEAIVASWTGIPVERMGADEVKRLAGMESNLKERIIGQDNAVECTARAMIRSRVGLKDPDRPTACLLFVGPTGVGKTELTKAVAEYQYGSKDAIIRLDMSEYMERHSVSKILGSPPGYVGYGEGGTLTEAVRRNPCSIVLFDEIEKAHPDVFSILLQIMEDGRLTDSQGRTVSFKNTLVVLTSNVGSRAIAANMTPSGIFRGTEYELPPDTSRVASLVQAEVKQYFRPELLNRLDEVIIFNKLGRQEVKHIADIMVKETADRLLQARQVTLDLTPRVIDKILTEGYSEDWGVRPLRSTIVRCVDDPVADALLQGRVGAGGVVVVDLDEEGEVVVYDGSEGRVTVADSAAGMYGTIKVTDTRRGNGSWSDTRQYANVMSSIEDN